MTKCLVLFCIFMEAKTLDSVHHTFCTGVKLSSLSETFEVGGARFRAFRQISCSHLLQ